jgi:hypothetical protein
MSRERFREFVREAILTLPQYVQGVLRMFEDPDIPDDGRALAAGTILHWLSGSNTIPGAPAGVLSYVDDVLLLRLAHARLAELAPDAIARHREDAPELFSGIDDELALIRSELGKGIEVLERSLAKVSKLKHRGQSAAQCVTNEEAATELYEEVQAALVDIDLGEEEVGRALKNGLDTLVENLRAG